MSQIILFLFTAFFSIYSNATAPKLNQWCFNEETTLGAERAFEWKYCIFISEGSQNHDVIYHFHGLGRDEIDKTGWSSNEGHYGLPVRELWAKAGYDAPTIVSISFGELWLLAEKNSSAVSGLYDFVTTYVFPLIEKNITANIGLIAKRHLVGESMGGFNVSQLVLKSPGLFTKAAILCPAIADLSPFATPEEQQSYIDRTGADPARVKMIVQSSRYFFPTPEDWQRHSPLSLAQTNFSSHTPELYISCGLSDEFGFQEGAQSFAELAINKGMNTTWVPIPDGKHCSVEVSTLANFLMDKKN